MANLPIVAEHLETAKTFSLILCFATGISAIIWLLARCLIRALLALLHALQAYNAFFAWYYSAYIPSKGISQRAWRITVLRLLFGSAGFGLFIAGASVLTGQQLPEGGQLTLATGIGLGVSAAMGLEMIFEGMMRDFERMRK